MKTADFIPLEYKLYGRQMILPELGTEGQACLKNSHALVIGAGGLGAPALLYLAGAGVGTITIVDDDEVEISNLHRQVIHSFATVGNSKAESAASTLRALNPIITVRTVKERFSEQNSTDLLEGVDVLLDGSDNFATRYLASAACAKAGIAHIWAAILGFDAQLSVFWAGKGPVYEDLYPTAPAEGSVPTCATAGVMGAMAGVVGTSMAMEALKVLAGIGRPLLGQVGYYSALEGRWEYIPLKARQRGELASPSLERKASKGKKESFVTISHKEGNLPQVPLLEDAKTCSLEQYQLLKQEQGAVLLDIREAGEYRALAIPDSYNLPLSQLEDFRQKGGLKAFISGEKDLSQAPLVLYCSNENRAQYALELLEAELENQVYLLAGGLGTWLDSIL